MKQSCPICGGDSFFLDVVDFNKSCEENRGYYLPMSGVPIYYSLCTVCGFCFTPEIYTWDVQDFATKIYNSDYIKVDPDYIDARPRSMVQFLVGLLGNKSSDIKHLDYGGGDGLLSKLLSESGWESTSYDPFVNKDINLESLGKFDFITAFEVFEHVPDVKKLIADLSSLLADDGIVFFSTLLSDGNIKAETRITWWYASPRNGHISLFSQKSLQLLCTQENFQVGSFSAGFHAIWKKVPQWASHFIGTP
jgi:SAM-dependent methyltransferase